MTDPALFWTKVSAIGQVLGTFATVAAVGLSLWIVLSERRPKLRVSAGLRLAIPGDGTPADDVIVITVANVGLRRVTCTSLGWRTGYLKRGPGFLSYQLALQNPAYAPGSVQLPVTIEPGEERSILQDVQAYAHAFHLDQRQSFFCRRLPWQSVPRRTRIDIIISLAAHNGVFAKVELGLAKFLATGEIVNGARRFNERAGINRN